MNPSVRSALTLAVLLVLPQRQALCPRLAPDVISGKVIPCRYLCIKINFLELPSIVLSTERDGVLCSTLLLRRRGECKNGGCMPFGSDDEIKPKGALGKVIAAIDKFASGSYRTKAPKPGTPFGPIVSTASSLFGGGSPKTSDSGGSSTSSAASSIVATATAAAVGSTFKKLLAQGASVLSEKKKHDEHPFSSILTSISKPDHHPAQTPGGTVSSSSGAVAVSFGGGPPVLPPSTEGGTGHESAHAAPAMPSASSPRPSGHPSLRPFVSASQPKPKDSLSPGSASGAPSSNRNDIKHAAGLSLGTISETSASGTLSASISQNGPTREVSGGGGATPPEFPFRRTSPIAPSPFSSGTKRDGRESLPGVPASANVVETGEPPMQPAASSVPNTEHVSKPSTIPSPYSRSPPAESQALSSASRAENSAGSRLNGPYGAAMARLREISQDSTRDTVPGQPSLATFGGTSVPSSGSRVNLHKGASGSEVNHNQVTVTNVPSAGAAPITADYGHGPPSVLPSTTRLLENKLEGASQWPGAPKMVSRPLNAPTQASGVPTGTLQRASELTTVNTIRMTSSLIGNAPLRSTSTYQSEISSGTQVETSLAKTLKTAKQAPAGASPVVPVGKPLSPVPGETSILTNNPITEISPEGANNPDAIPTELGMRPPNAKPAPAAVEFGGKVTPIALSSMTVPGDKGAEGSQLLTTPSTILRSTAIPVKSGGSSVLPNLPAAKKGSAGKTSGPGSGASRVRPKERFFRGFFSGFKHTRKQNRAKSQSTQNQAVKVGVASPSRDWDSTKPKMGITLNSGVKNSTLPSPPAAAPNILPNLLSTRSERKEPPSSPARTESQTTKSTGVESIISNKKITDGLGKTGDTLLLKLQRAPSKLPTKGTHENNVSSIRSSSHGGVETKVIVGRQDLPGKAGHINLPHNVPPKLNFGAAIGPIANTPSTSRLTSTLSALPTTALQGNKQDLALGQRNENKAPLTVPSGTGTTERNTNNGTNIESVNKPSSSSLSTRTPSTKEETRNAVSPGTELPSRHGSTFTGTKTVSSGISSISPPNTVSAPSKTAATIGTPSSTHSGNQWASKPIATQENRVSALAAASKGGNESYGSNQGSQTSLREATPNAVPPNIGAPSRFGSATSTTVTAAENAPPSISSISRDNTITPSKPIASIEALSSVPSGNQLSPKPISALHNPLTSAAAAPKGRNPSYGGILGSQTSFPRTPSTKDETKNAASPSIEVPSKHGSAASATVSAVKNSSPGISPTLQGNTVATPFKPTGTSGALSSAHSGSHLTPKPIEAQQNPASAVAATSYTGSHGSHTSGPMEKTANAHSTGGPLSIKSGTSSQSPPSTSGRVESKISPSRDNSSTARYVLTTQRIGGVSKASAKPTVASSALPVSTSTSVTATLGGQSSPSVPNANAASRMGGTLATIGASEKPVRMAGSLPSTKGSVSLGQGVHPVPIPTLASAASGITSASSVRNVMDANRLAGTSGTAGTSEKHTPTGSPPSGIKERAPLIRAENTVETPRQLSLKPTNTIANVNKTLKSTAGSTSVAKAVLRLAAPIVRSPGSTFGSSADVPTTPAASKTTPSNPLPQTSRNQSTKAKNVTAPGSASNLAANAPITSASQNVQAPKLLAAARTMTSVNIPKSEPRLRSLPLPQEENASNNAKAPGRSASSLQKVGTNYKNVGAPALPALSLPGEKIASSGPVEPRNPLQPPEKPSGIAGRLGSLLTGRRDALKSAVQSGSSAVSNLLSKIATNNVKNTVPEARPTTVANGPTQSTAPEKHPPSPPYGPPANTPTTPINNAEQQNPPMYPGMQQQGGILFGRHPMSGGFWGPSQAMARMFRPF